MWIKICGVTRLQDALTVMNSGADAIGFNFYERSKRYIAPDAVHQVVREMQQHSQDSGVSRVSAVSGVSAGIPAQHGTQPKSALPALPRIVGVFVNASAATVAATVQRAGLSCVQFHGDESPELIAEFHQLLPQIPVIRAYRVNSANMADTLRAVKHLASRVPLNACLLDALVDGHYGGTGHQLEESVVKSYLADGALPPLILAGGLTPGNVANPLKTLQPWGVDTASGVESAPGIKDSDLVHAFVRSARTACSVRRE